MYSLLKSLSFIVFIFALALAACDDEEKTTYLPIGGGGAHKSAGDLIPYAADGVSFLMAYVPGGRFPTGSGSETSPDEDGANPQTVRVPYWMAETEVTYELWYKVRAWAETAPKDHDGDGFIGDDIYSFANDGREGNDGTVGDPPTEVNREPVTCINWRDAMVWCNALTEWYNAHNGNKPDLDCVYYADPDYMIPLRTSTNDSVDTSPADGVLDNSLIAGSEDFPYIKASSSGNTDMANCTAKGFRLPTSMEWECAARYRDGIEWTPGNFASGATADYTDDEAIFAVGVFSNYSDGDATGVASTAAVKSKRANALGLYDMSGNVYEWCFDWHTIGVGRSTRGGCWGSPAASLQVSNMDAGHPYVEGDFLGFRLSRTN